MYVRSERGWADEHKHAGRDATTGKGGGPRKFL
eukprot:CAMPEP_0198680806 /NCGR_PEP_ID=MMETSP1468-20131203/5567_1 /TAXON_ID=1461545 /ORGANISM="Mantoniella sp, Strain CCMP1436" /LENGTH=32 /DNA_ID= /DNA_START= /DNA_END= /DNA_ORIENTATION=